MRPRLVIHHRMIKRPLKLITSENVAFEAQFKTFFSFHGKIMFCAFFMRFSTFYVLDYSINFQKYNVVKYISTQVRVYFWVFPTNTPRVFHVETTWKRSFPRRFNVENTWSVCRVRDLLLF